MNVSEIIGVIGFIGYIVSYAMLQAGVVAGNDLDYIILNLISAVFVLISLKVTFNLASALIQCSWIVISFWGIFRAMKASERDIGNSLKSHKIAQQIIQAKHDRLSQRLQSCRHRRAMTVGDALIICNMLSIVQNSKAERSPDHATVKQS